MDPTTIPVMAPALPEIVLTCIAMALLMVGVFRRGDPTRLVSVLALIGLVITALLVLTHGGTADEPAFFGMFETSPFVQFAKILILIGSALAIVMSRDYLYRERAQRFEYPVLIIFATVGMMMMVSANDLIALYVGLELQSLSLYVLAAIRRDTLRATEAGLKYFVLGALSSGMLLYGCSLIYGFAGTTDFARLAQVATELQGPVPVGLVFGLIFLVSGLAFKVSAVPFHMWTPDVYEGAPTPVTALFAIAPKVAAVCLFLRVAMVPFGELIDQWQQVIALIAILSMALGALAALVQTNIKRLMAYSSIGHMGYVLVGIAAGNPEGASGVLIYLAVYLFMTAGTFVCILAMRRQGRIVEGIHDLAGLSRTHPLMAVALLILMFSMAGIPPLAGFFGKWFVFLAAIKAELYLLAVIGVVSSVIGAFYYLRIVKIMYFEEGSEPLDGGMPTDLRAVLLVSTAVTLFFFLVPGPVIDMARSAAAALTGT